MKWVIGILGGAGAALIGVWALHSWVITVGIIMILIALELAMENAGKDLGK